MLCGQNATAKGPYARRNVECLDTAHGHGILAIYYKPPEVPYCYYKLVTNVIRAVFCHICGIRSGIPRLSANQHSGLEPPVYNCH